MRRLPGGEHERGDGSSTEVGESIKIAYLCDGLDKCSDGVMCFRRRVPGADCKHTFNPKHAANGIIGHPENYPDRFHLIDPKFNNGEICYWEGEIDIP